MFTETLGDDLLGRSFFKKIRKTVSKVVPKPLKKLAVIATAPVSILTPGGRRVIRKLTPKVLIKPIRVGTRVTAGAMTGGASEILYAKRRAAIQAKKKKQQAPMRAAQALAAQQAAIQAAEQAELDSVIAAQEAIVAENADPLKQIAKTFSSISPTGLVIVAVGSLAFLGLILSKR